MIKALLKRVLIGSYIGRHRGPHVTRFAMYLALKDICADNNRGAGKKILSISNSTKLIPIIGIESANVVEANYPEYNILDLYAFADDTFDFVISDQVLEHVEGNPKTAFDETFRILKPGGTAVHTTCFINPVHGAPKDFWRFTPDALRLLAEEFSEIIVADGWGNRAVWVLDALGMRWAPIPHAKWHPLHVIAMRNNKEWPVSTWIVARK